MTDQEIRELLHAAEVRHVQPADLPAALARGRRRALQRRLVVAGCFLLAGSVALVPAERLLHAARAHDSTLAGPGAAEIEDRSARSLTFAAKRFVSDSKACLAGQGYDINGQPNSATGTPPPAIAFTQAQATCTALFGTAQAPRNELPRTTPVTSTTPGDYSENLQACLAGLGITVVVTGTGTYTTLTPPPSGLGDAETACTRHFGAE